MNRWIRPSCDTRTGASHLRRGAPCQDASGVVGCLDAAGTPIQVLVVSDGHGGARYGRSDVGARLACTVAMRELQQALAPARVASPGALEEWRGWLAQELPARIVAAWRREVESHWRAIPGAEGAGFSPVLYGATLGVLVLTPFWWAHTGLGDWDLVRIGADGGEGAGGEALVSEEPECEGGGEATFSLCLEGAERHFAARTALYPLAPEVPPFALLLGSDGLRKSCGSDADFLTLCRYLAGLSPSRAQAGSAELAEALDHISAQGSGDDISVAVARWGGAGQGTAWPEPGRCEPALWIQPVTGALLDPLNPAMTAHEAGARSAVMPQPAAAAVSVLTEQPASVDDGQADSIADPGRRSVFPAQLRRFAPLLQLVVAVLALGGLGLLALVRLDGARLSGRREPLPPALTPQQRAALQRQVAALCNPMDPARPPQGLASSGPVAARFSSGTTTLDLQMSQRLAATLSTRASVFQRLAGGDANQVKALLGQSRVDPLSALIAYSAMDASPPPLALPNAGPSWWQGLGERLAGLLPLSSRSARTTAVAPSPLASLGACPELKRALRSAWQRHAAPLPAVSPRDPADAR